MDTIEIVVLLSRRTKMVSQSSPGATQIELEQVDQEDLGMIQQYALAMECEISDDGSINLAAFFDPVVIDKARIGWLLQHFANVILQLESLCISGESTVSEISLATEYDQEIFWSRNKNCPEAPDTCVHQIIEEQALRTPRLRAIRAHDRNLDYGELDQLSSEVAYNLIGMNVGPGVKIPICIEKSSTMVVALLAILKAGAAYVPLDPAYPSSRIEHILGEVEAGMVLVSETTSSRFDGIADITVVSVERIISQYRKSSSGPRTLPRVSLSEVAYVIFTSGSTGTPKGVVMEHSALSTTVISEGKTFGYRQGLRVLQYTNIIFDTSIAEIFTTLAYGGCVCIPSENNRMNCLVETMSEMEVELAHLTPTVMSLMDLKQIPSLRTLAAGGEPLTHANVQNSSDAGVRVMNAYGPTETCVDVIINTAVTPDSNPNNIGYPRTCRAWILEVDNSDRLTPLGCVGELAIEGPTLARGYLNDEEKTNASFLENLSWMRHGRSRVYKTGDLARFNGDGSIQYLGRRDTQVKVNGQRIELEEIESQIRRSRGNLQVAVEYLAEGKRSILVAFLVDEAATPYPMSELIVSSPSDRFTHLPREIVTSLKDFIPAYMIPSLFIPISHLPISPSGKLDRRRLQEGFSCLSEDEIRGHRFQFVGEKSLPTTKTEEMLQGLWAKVLDICDLSTIGLDDGFFDLGGDSITAIQLVAAVRREGFLLTVADVFASPKLRQMSGDVLQKKHSSNSKSVDLQVPPTPPPPFTLLPDARNRGARLDQISAEISTDRISIQDAYPATAIQLACVIEGQKWHRSWYSWFTLEIEGAMDSERLRHACQSVVDHHPILRTVFCMDGRRGLQVVLGKNTIDFEALQDTESDHDLILSMCNDTRPVAFGKNMVKFRLLSLDQTTHRLAVGLSHAQYDGMCLALILGDIQTAYLHQPLPTRPSYSIFIDYALKANSEDAELFWRTTLQGFTMTNLVSRRLPSDRYHLQSREVRDIYPPASSKASGATFSTILKAAWSLVLARYCGRSDIIFGNLISGRNAPIEGIEEMIGPCMNILPTPVRLDQDWSYNDLLSHVLAQQLAMIPYETMAYADIVEKCTQWPRSTRFGSVVQHQNLPAPVQHNGGPGEPTWETAGPISYPGLCDEVDCWVCSVPHGDHVTIDLRHNDQILPSSTASVLLDSLCTIVMDIFENTDRNIMSAISTVGTPISPLLLPILAKTTNTTAILENVETTLNSQVLSTLRDAWQETLVGDAAAAEMQDDMDANFFDMGGDSVAAAQLATSCARQQLGVSIQDIFDYPTIRLQALLASGALERARPVEREGHNVTFWEG